MTALMPTLRSSCVSIAQTAVTGFFASGLVVSASTMYEPASRWTMRMTRPTMTMPTPAREQDRAAAPARDPHRGGDQREHEEEQEVARRADHLDALARGPELIALHDGDLARVGRQLLEDALADARLVHDLLEDRS